MKRRSFLKSMSSTALIAASGGLSLSGQEAHEYNDNPTADSPKPMPLPQKLPTKSGSM